MPLYIPVFKHKFNCVIDHVHENKFHASDMKKENIKREVVDVYKSCI